MLQVRVSETAHVGFFQMVIKIVLVTLLAALISQGEPISLRSQTADAML